jgi:hypothetical protein
MQPDRCQLMDWHVEHLSITSSSFCTLHLKLPMCAGEKNAIVSLKLWCTITRLLGYLQLDTDASIPLKQL